MKTCFTYEVVLYPSDSDEYSLSQGIGFCQSFADAAHQVEEMYGEDLHMIKSLRLIDTCDSGILLLSRDSYSSILNQEQQDLAVFYPCDEDGNLPKPRSSDLTVEVEGDGFGFN